MGSCRLEDDACCFLSGVRCVSIAAYATADSPLPCAAQTLSAWSSSTCFPFLSCSSLFVLMLVFLFLQIICHKRLPAKARKMFRCACIVLDCKPTDKIRRIYSHIIK